MTRPKRSRMLTVLYLVLALFVAGVVGIVVILYRQVDDWSRDLNTNFAATDDQAPDHALRPIYSHLPPAELAAIVEEAAAGLPRWELAEKSDSADAVNLHYIRTTPLLKFQDDIRVAIEPMEGGGSLLSAASQSRVGKGDLGQNPRNLRELLGAVRAAARGR